MGRYTFLLSSFLFLVLFAVACGGDGENPNRVLPTPTDEEHAKERIHPSNPLIDAERNELSICVTGEGGYVSNADDLARVEAALNDGLAKHDGLPVEYGSRSVTEGCPPTRVPLGRATSGPSAYGRPVETPSKHFMFVYLLPEATYHATFPIGERYSLGSAEHVCSGDTCERATFGLYLPSNADPSDIERALLEALRLVPGTPLINVELTPGFEEDGGVYVAPTPTP